MTLEELEKFPNVLDALREHYTKKLEDSIKQTENIPDDFKEMLKERGITDDTIIAVINENPAALFYFFDSYKMYINITTFSDGSFSYSIIGDVASLGSTETFSSRKEAEKEVIKQAITQLETALTKSVSSKKNS
jgi:hypothetical protein